MNFSNLSPLMVAAGLGGLAISLFLLQFLRIRHRQLTIPTTMFWKMAVQEAPVRVFRGKFRHPLAYLLALLIAALLWIGFAHPTTDKDNNGDYYVLFLDGSAYNSGKRDFERSVAKLRNDVKNLPKDNREVVWGGAYNLKILDSGEDQLLLNRYLESLKPEASLSSLDEYLRLIPLGAQAKTKTNVIVYGNAPVSKDTLETLPDHIQIRRVGVNTDKIVNIGITALGIGDASSGRRNEVDVLIRLDGTQGADINYEALEVRIDGQVISDIERIRRPDGSLVLRNVPGNGGVLTAQLLSRDDIAFDNKAALNLPGRDVIDVLISGALSSVVVRALEADKGINRVFSDGDVVVRMYGETLGEGLPALEFIDQNGQQAFNINYTGDISAQTALERSLSGLGLDQIDVTGLASKMNEPIGVSVNQANDKRVQVWEALLNEDYNFVHSRSFPIFVSKSVRWLQGSHPWYPYLAVGKPLKDRSGELSLAPADRGAFNVLGAEYIPARAGEVKAVSGEETFQVSLLNRPLSSGLAGAELKKSSVTAAAITSSSGIVLWILLGVLLLLVVEWVLYQRGLMP